MNFDTWILSLRYGATSRLNLTATAPRFSISSDKFQGEPYLREHAGLGDLILSAEYAILTSPHVLVEAGVKLPTGNIDETDARNQRFDDILSLGSGTTDIVVGGGLWFPHAGIRKLDLVARVRHRFTGGQNKYGYRFGEETSFLTHLYYPFMARTGLGLRLDGYHTTPDTWYGITVPERGATMVTLGPSLSWLSAPGVSVGAFARFPVYMDLEGGQMVAPVIFGFEMSTNLTPLFQHVRGGSAS